MSDYWPEPDLPLFSQMAPAQQHSSTSMAAATRKVRTYHERDQTKENVLKALRLGQKLDKKSFEASVANGSRLAPVIEQLRNAHGFCISGDGSTRKPYTLDDFRQTPCLARVSPEMKDAYYQLPHWHSVKSKRSEIDGHKCVLCRDIDDLRCHHVCYEKLFCEPLEDLLTLCECCHDRVHEHSRLKFPSGVSVQEAHQLGWKGFETWLLP